MEKLTQTSISLHENEAEKVIQFLLHDSNLFRNAQPVIKCIIIKGLNVKNNKIKG